jgi:hypothetical protein
MGGCSTVEVREGRSSTAAVRMARWRGNAGGKRGERAFLLEWLGSEVTAA